MSDSRKLNLSLLLGLIALVLFAFWPLDPHTDAEKLPALLPMQSASHPAQVGDGLLVNTDWDGDGADDIVSLNGKHIGIYKLHKADLELRQIARVESDDNGQALAAASVDWDADGDIDLIAVHNYGLALYENHDQRIRPRLVTDWAVSKAWIALNDADRDGQIEITLATIADGQQQTAIYNLKGEVVQRLAEIAGPVAWSDFDNNGRDELLIAPTDQAMRLLRQDDGQWLEMKLPTGSAAWSSIAIADYDADGDQDVLLSNSGYSTRWQLLKNQSSNEQFNLQAVEHQPLSRIRYAAQAAWVDLNADGLQDVVAAQNQPNWLAFGCCEGVVMLQKQHYSDNATLEAAPKLSREFVNASQWSSLLSGASSVVSGDYNGDGLADIAAYSVAGEIKLQVNQRDQNYVSIRLPQVASSFGARVTVETTAGKTYTQEMRGYGDLHFGLGPNWKSKNLIVRWVDGALTIVEQPHINQRLDIAR